MCVQILYRLHVIKLFYLAKAITQNDIQYGGNDFIKMIFLKIHPGGAKLDKLILEQQTAECN